MIDNKKQWFLLILAVVWPCLILALISGAYTITRDVHSFELAALATPVIALLRPLYRYHFPPPEADCKMQKLKIQLKDCRKKRP